MNIAPISSRPASIAQARLPPYHAAGIPEFTRPVKDGAPGGLAGGPLPRIDPNAPAAEQVLFAQADQMAGGHMPRLGIRLRMLLATSGDALVQEQFAFGRKPASVLAQGPQIVINVGSADDGSTGQITLLNGQVREATGTSMLDPLKRRAAVQQASLAICLGIARRNDMPQAAAAIQELQRYSTLFDESGRYIGS
jgi:hypothetical protein